MQQHVSLVGYPSECVRRVNGSAAAVLLGPGIGFGESEFGGLQCPFYPIRSGFQSEA